MSLLQSGSKPSFVLKTALIVLFGCPAPATNSSAQPAPPTKAPVTAQAAQSAKAGMRLPADQVVAQWKGGKMTYGQLMEQRSKAFDKLRKKHVREMFDLERQELEATIVQSLIQAKAKSKGLSEEQFLKSIATSVQVGEPEILAFYEARVKSSGRPLEQVKDQIRGFLAESKQREAIQAEIQAVRKEAGLKVDLPAPVEVRATFSLEGRPMKGKPDAKVTMVEFSDFECPYCSKATPQVEAILKAYPNDVKVYFLHYPLSFHKSAMPAAIATECAFQQGKFWELHDKLFASQSALKPDGMAEFAKAVGLDMAKYNTCVADPKTTAMVKKDMEQAEAAGVQGTPSFFINGVQYPGVPNVDALKSHVSG